MQRQHPVDRVAARQGVAEPDQHRRDATVVTGACPRQAAVEVRVQVQLGDGEACARPSSVRYLRGEVQGRQPDRSGQVVVVVVRQQGGHGVLGRAVPAPVAEGGDGCPAYGRVLVVRQRHLQHRTVRDLPARQPEGLHEAHPRGRLRARRHRPFQRQGDVVGSRRRPGLQRPLGQHPGEAAGDDDLHQASDRLEPGEPTGEHPGRVLADEGPVVREQGRQRGIGLVVDRMTQGMDGSDRGQLVVGVVDGVEEHPDRSGRTVGGDGGRQDVTGSQHVDHERCVPHLPERCAHVHHLSTLTRRHRGCDLAPVRRTGRPPSASRRTGAWSVG